MKDLTIIRQSRCAIRQHRFQRERARVGRPAECGERDQPARLAKAEGGNPAVWQRLLLPYMMEWVSILCKPFHFTQLVIGNVTLVSDSGNTLQKPNPLIRVGSLTAETHFLSIAFFSLDRHASHHPVKLRHTAADPLFHSPPSSLVVSKEGKRKIFLMSFSFFFFFQSNVFFLLF